MPITLGPGVGRILNLASSAAWMISPDWHRSNFQFPPENRGLGRRGNFGTDSSEMEKFKPVSLQIWSVPMILRYLHLQKRKYQLGPTYAPFGVMTLFGVIFFPQIFFLPKFFLPKFFFYPNFFLPKFFLPKFFFFFGTFFF